MLLTPWKRHKVGWSGCQRCPLCQTRRNVVLARGVLPAEVLFIGEAPGPSEDTLGECFIGPAGHLLDKMIADAIQQVKPRRYPRLAFTNLVACIPRDESGEKWAEPPKESIIACAPRLVEFIDICKPQRIVCVGAVSEKWVPKILNGDVGVKKKNPGARVTDGKRLRQGPGMSQRGVVGQAVGGLRSGRDAEPSPDIVHIIHPAAILRAGIAYRPLAIQKVVVALADLFEELNQC